MQSIVLQLRGLSLISCGASRNVQRLNIGQIALLGDQKSNGYHTSVTNNSFFNKSSGEDIWKAMSGVSAQGKKRGRARNMLKKTDLNRGQVIGFGKKKIDFPGLTSNPIIGPKQDQKAKNWGNEGYIIYKIRRRFN